MGVFKKVLIGILTGLLTYSPGRSARPKSRCGFAGRAYFKHPLIILG
ncbi:MAG TPA: hypothetical protein PKK23_11135 [Nitrospirales bacterium]|nr:hypothetical protein [Nitrospirales bacterium]